jgi:ribosomal protein S18 acetylase RimI-like enzyme
MDLSTGRVELTPELATRSGTVAIRPANNGDVEALCEIYYDFHEFHVRGVPTHLCSLGDRERWDRSDLRGALEAILQGDDSELFVAQAASRLAGLVEIYLRQDPEEVTLVPHRYAELQSLMVLPAFRRRGVGTRLVEAARRWARENGAAEIRLGVWEFNEAAREFYEALGFRTLKRRMVAELTSEPLSPAPPGQGTYRGAGAGTSGNQGGSSLSYLRAPHWI